jgi:hypothetical protein
MGSMGGVTVIRSLAAVAPMGRGFDPRLGYFMLVEFVFDSLRVHTK